MLKKAKHWILILLVCVLFVGLIPGKASAAAAEMWVYNGHTLPALPEWDTDAYPYARIRQEGIWYYFEVLSELPETTANSFTGTELNGIPGVGRWGSANCLVDELDAWDSWSYVENSYSRKNITTFIWANYNVYTAAGQLYMAASEPQRIAAPDVPTFRVNLPRNHVYQYELNETPAQLYVDAYVTATDQTVLYTWEWEVDGEWLTVDSGDPHSKYYTPLTSVEGTYRYRCVASNTVNGYTSSSVSNAVYVLVGASASVPDGVGEDISPGDQLIIDQMGQIKDDVGSIKDGIEEAPDKIVEGIEGVLETEKQEVNDAGQSSVDQLLEVVPDIGGDFITVFQFLAPCFQYEGTEAVLPIPELRMPAIPGVTDGCVLLGAQEYNFESVVQIFPEGLLFVVQCVLSVGLCLFFFKEVYSVISYIFMGRSDNE